MLPVTFKVEFTFELAIYTYIRETGDTAKWENLQIIKINEHIWDEQVSQKLETK